ncbi:MAG: HAD family hydrolase [Bdellovibrionaceae bacterium]|nr:HAD family hydrolase [Pseudobdellovibrionaceae bacterium]MDW8190868.1 HAD family hydrolase [Pseudobdellovibrionaceae bacterium]
MGYFKHIIFDLDDTLLDTSQILIPIRSDEAQFWKRLQEPLPLLPGALDNLNYLKRKYILHLLTQGKKKYQEQKIRSMNISEFFSQITIIETEQSQTKEDFFATFCDKYQIPPHQVLSVGNRLSTDLGPAKKYGMMTCWFCYGEGQDEEAQNYYEKPDFIIRHHYEMIKKCRL